MSAIYKNFIIHERLIPRKYKFGFKFFWYYFDLDELEDLSQKSLFFSYNKFNLFSYFDKDHLDRNTNTTKENIIHFLKKNGIFSKCKTIKILTNLRFLGYVFNPVTYYFIETEDNNEYCVIEICNTYKEIKPYFVDGSNLNPKKNKFEVTAPKEFYISPFSDLNNYMKFKISKPDDYLKISISDFKKDHSLELRTALVGKRMAFNDKVLFASAIAKPFATLQIIIAIHWHALKLFLRRVPYFKKDNNKHLQKGYYLWKS